MVELGGGCEETLFKNSIRNPGGGGKKNIRPRSMKESPAGAPLSRYRARPGAIPGREKLNSHPLTIKFPKIYEVQKKKIYGVKIIITGSEHLLRRKQCPYHQGPEI